MSIKKTIQNPIDNIDQLTKIKSKILYFIVITIIFLIYREFVLYELSNWVSRKRITYSHSLYLMIFFASILGPLVEEIRFRLILRYSRLNFAFFCGFIIIMPISYFIDSFMGYHSAVITLPLAILLSLVINFFIKSINLKDSLKNII